MRKKGVTLASSGDSLRVQTLVPAPICRDKPCGLIPGVFQQSLFREAQVSGPQCDPHPTASVAPWRSRLCGARAPRFLRADGSRLGSIWPTTRRGPQKAWHG